METKESILVLSYETDISNNTNAKLFRDTLEKYKWNYRFIGEGSVWSGVNDKVLGYYNYLCQYIHDNTIVILCDSRDVFCVRGPDFFIDRISSIVQSKIIISGELFLIKNMNWTKEQIDKKLSQDPTYFWQGIPLDNYWDYYNISKDCLPSRKYVNSGLIIGKASHLKNGLKWILDNNYNDDQLGWANYTNTFPEKVYLDTSASILHTSTGFVNGGLYDFNIQKHDIPSFEELFGFSSYFLHIPGINGSIGQKLIYNTIAKLFNDNILGKSMFDIYGVKPSNPIHNNYFEKN